LQFNPGIPQHSGHGRRDFGRAGRIAMDADGLGGDGHTGTVHRNHCALLDNPECLLACPARIAN